VTTKLDELMERRPEIDCIDPLPGWQAGNPSAIYVRFIGLA